MDSGIRIKKIWQDERALELEITTNSADFLFCIQVYVGHEELTDLAKGLALFKGDIQSGTFASCPGDLVSHECITYEGYAAADRWEFRFERTSQLIQVASRLTVNSAEAAVIAAIADAGIARVLSDQVAKPLRSGALVRLLQAFEPTPMPASLVYPQQRQVPLKLRAFLDFATPRLRQRLGYENAKIS
ncbi:LysR substrate-binding domain-containing protein [Dyella acidisoli]|uniref:LysR substrate-binding domain-containing protein n=1 Tax=Dyella acidisoli TaxID=1867834 RepID=A0ABQ5XIN2_9GAMM|nr:LysR substrate-binding domain-containing protein [Dyella acidisoli]GLQ91518.1 hypothetical protein GCM10007901_04680 [Dyella acidisoli]